MCVYQHIQLTIILCTYTGYGILIVYFFFFAVRRVVTNSSKYILITWNFLYSYITLLVEPCNFIQKEKLFITKKKVKTKFKLYSKIYRFNKVVNFLIICKHLTHTFTTH